MFDKVELRVAGIAVDRFNSYSINSNMFNAGDPFTLDLANSDVRVPKGAQCKLYVNGEIELNGIVDRPQSSGGGREGHRRVLSGRDLMGLVVDHYLLETGSQPALDLKTLAARVLKDVPFINRKSIRYAKGGKLEAKEDRWGGSESKGMQTSPGDTSFVVLKRAAVSIGWLFFCMPDGTFIFGKPVTSGKAMFNIIRRNDGVGSNVETGSLVEDISKEYSHVTVMGQGGADEWEDEDTGGGNYVTLENKGFPFYKPFVTVLDEEDSDYARHAALLLSKQRFDGYQLSYVVKGHSQHARNWQVNAICHVDDEVEGVKGNFLIYSRTFRKDKHKGTLTDLKLSRLGALPS